MIVINPLCRNWTGGLLRCRPYRLAEPRYRLGHTVNTSGPCAECCPIRTRRLDEQKGSDGSGETIFGSHSFLGVNPVSQETVRPDGRSPAPIRDMSWMSRARTRQLTSQAQARGNT